MERLGEEKWSVTLRFRGVAHAQNARLRSPGFLRLVLVIELGAHLGMGVVSQGPVLKRQTILKVNTAR